MGTAGTSCIVRFRRRRSRFHPRDRGLILILVCMSSAIKMVEPAENEFLASLEAKTKKSSPFFRAMANRTDVLKSFVPFYGAIMGPGAVYRRTKELVYLTCFSANEWAFCPSPHSATRPQRGLHAPAL